MQCVASFAEDGKTKKWIFALIVNDMLHIVFFLSAAKRNINFDNFVLTCSFSCHKNIIFEV